MSGRSPPHKIRAVFTPRKGTRSGLTEFEAWGDGRLPVPPAPPHREISPPIPPARGLRAPRRRSRRHGQRRPDFPPAESSTCTSTMTGAACRRPRATTSSTERETAGRTFRRRRRIPRSRSAAGSTLRPFRRSRRRECASCSRTGETLIGLRLRSNPVGRLRFFTNRTFYPERAVRLKGQRASGRAQATSGSGGTGERREEAGYSISLRPGRVAAAGYCGPVEELFPAKAIFISGRGARTRLHRDPWASDAVLCQLYGSKQIVMFSPEQAQLLSDGESVVDIEDPDPKLFPQFKTKTCRIRSDRSSWLASG